jgi:hypothetical protein
MSEYEEIAYRKLGLSGEGYDVGTMRYIDLPEDVLDTLCIRRLNFVGENLYDARPPATDLRLWRKDIAANYFLRHHEWLHILKTIRSHEPKDWRDTTLPADARFRAVAESRFMRRLYEGGKYEPTLAGWKRYLKAATPRFYEFLLEAIPVRLPHDKLLNAYIVAASQSGKTELLKLFGHSIIARGSEALVFIEPAGDASRQIAEWPELGNRLIYVDHALEVGMTPTINPFEISAVPAADTSPQALAVKTVVAQQLLSAFQEVLATGEGAELTKNMQTVLQQCLLVLLDFPGATVRHLLRFMNDDRNADLTGFAQSRMHYPDVQEFFTYSFLGKRSNLDRTKVAIETKLQDLFSTGHFADLTCGKSTIDLEKALEERKVIIFNLSKGALGERESSAFGRLIVAILQGIAMRREWQRNHAPVRVIIDEVHNFTTKSLQTIITEAAKFQLFLIMAQQQIGQGMAPEMRNAVLNASAQIAGRNSPSFYGPVAGMLHVEPGIIENLRERGEFVIHLSGVRPFKFKIHTHLLGRKHRISDSKWEKVKADQLRRYYRPTTAPAPAPVKIAELAAVEDEDVI